MKSLSRLACLLISLCISCACALAQEITDVQVSSSGNEVKISYSLSEPTDNVRIEMKKMGDKRFMPIVAMGDVDKPLEAGQHAITYIPLAGKAGVWRADSVVFRLSAVIAAECVSDFFPLDGITLGKTSSQGYPLNQYNSYEVSEGFFLEISSTKRFDWYSSDRPPMQWSSKGLRQGMSANQAAQALSKLGMAVEIGQIEGKNGSWNCKVNGRSRYLEFEIDNRYYVYDKKEKKTAPTLDSEATFNHIRVKYTGKSNLGERIALSDPATLTIYSDEKFKRAADYDNVEEGRYNDGHVCYYLNKDGFVGVADSAFNVLIEPNQYVRVAYIEGANAYNALIPKSKYSCLVGCYAADGRQILPPKFDFIQITPQGPIWARKGEKWELYGRDGKLLTKEKFDAVYHYDKYFFDGLARMTKKFGKKALYGYVDTKGNIVVPFKYSSASDFSNGLAIVSDGDKDYMIDKKGVPVPLNIPQKPGYANQISYRGNIADDIAIVRHARVENGSVSDPTHYIYNFTAGKGVPLPLQRNYYKLEARDTLYILHDPALNKYHAIGLVDAHGNLLFPVSSKNNVNPVGGYSDYINAHYYDKNDKSIQCVYDSRTGQKVADGMLVYIRESNGIFALFKQNSSYITLCDRDLNTLYDLKFKFAEGSDNEIWAIGKETGLCALTTDSCTIYRDALGNPHLRPGDADEIMKGTLVEELAGRGTPLWMNAQGGVFASKEDALSARNNALAVIASAPVTTSLTKEDEEKAKIGDPEALFRSYLRTRDPQKLRQAADAGYPHAMTYMAVLLTRNTETEAEAEKMLAAAIEAGDPGAILLSALEDIDRQQLENAYDKFISASKTSDPIWKPYAASMRAEAATLAAAHAMDLLAANPGGDEHLRWMDISAAGGNILAQKWQGGRWHNEGDILMAADYYALAADQGDAEAAYAAACEYAAADKHSKAVAYMAKAASANYEDADMRAGYMYLDDLPGVGVQLPNAYNWLSHAKKRGYDEVDDMLAKTAFVIAMDEYKKGRYASSNNYISTYLQIYPDSVKGHAVRGNNFYKLGHYEDALNSYEKQLKLDPNSLQASENVAEAKRKIREEQERKEAERRRKEAYDGYVAAARSAYSSRYYSVAIDNALAALAMEQTASMYNLAGNSYYNLGDYQTALGYYQAALGVDPSNADARRMAANCQAAMQPRQQMTPADWFALSQQFFSATQTISNSLVGNRQKAGHAQPARRQQPAATRQQPSQNASHSASHSHSKPANTRKICTHCGGTGRCTEKVGATRTLGCNGSGQCPARFDMLYPCEHGYIKATGNKCQHCHGTAKCPHCGGTGKCAHCHGSGYM